MEEKLTKKIAEEVMKFKGNVIGEAPKTAINYIQEKKGKQGIKIIEKRMEELGFPLEVDKIETHKWFPVGLWVLFILVAKDMFDWKDNDIFNLGRSVSKYAFFTKLVMRYFVSIEKFIKIVPSYWAKYWDFNTTIEVYKYDKETKQIILHKKGFNVHPILCIYQAGYFLGIASLITKSNKITIEETKCVFKRDSYDEYVIKWE